MKRPLSVVSKVTVALLALILAASCANTMRKGYEGSPLGAEETSIIASGPYTEIKRCDGVTLKSSELSVAVLSGKHTVEIAFPPRLTDNAFYYSNVTSLLTFDAEAGHRYLAVAYLVLPDLWLAYVADRTTGRRVVESAPLPLNVEWLYRDFVF